jgi:hypothetical protein
MKRGWLGGKRVGWVHGDYQRRRIMNEKLSGINGR